MKNNYTYRIVDTAGQLTPVVTSRVPVKKQISLSNYLLKKYPDAGQVAFLCRNKDEDYFAKMAGNELSINGSIATAYIVMKLVNNNKVKIKVSGLNNPVLAKLFGNVLSMSLPISIVLSQRTNRIKFAGISYVFISSPCFKEFLRKKEQDKILVKLLKDSEAAGIVYYSKDEIKPLIAVKSLGTQIWETACGSASIGFFLLTGKSKIIQPSGKYINVRKKGDKLIVGTIIKEITQ